MDRPVLDKRATPASRPRLNCVVATPDPTFEPTPQAARRALAAVRPSEYARTRNRLDGAVTHLGPYITHGFLDLAEVLEHLRLRGVDAQHKLVFELGWRAWFRHVWAHEGDAIFGSLGCGPLPDEAYARELPADVREARTGLAVIDESVRTLYRSGTLHNHARMWLASYLVHGRKVHWRAGADWLYGHLLDGDLASNHLSWQWVAGTGSHRPYLFNAENVERHAPPAWHVDGSALDCSYAALEASARDPRSVLPGGTAPGGVDEPALLDAPPAGASCQDSGFSAPDPALVAGREVWLVHPWSLADAPDDRPPDAVVVAVCDAGFHARWPWSAARWRFVGARLREAAEVRWWGSADSIVQALQAARRVRGRADPHLSSAFDALSLDPAPPAFDQPTRRCRSFSAWWAKSRCIPFQNQPELFTS